MDMKGTTRVCGLIGNPVGHSISPVIHNTLADITKTNMVYTTFKVDKEDVAKAVEGAYALDILGLNVTVPHKQSVMDVLADIDPLAKAIGAVNTLVRKDGGYKGYNTDILGLKRELEDESISLCGNNCIILGAGGAARAICSSLAYRGAAKIIVSSLFDWESEQLVQNINANFAPVASMIPWGEQQALLHAAEPADMIINATGVGMGAHVGESPVDKAIFRPGMVAFDAAYNPSVTKFLADAADCGCTTFNGLGMLLYQGTAQFELWTGTQAPVDLMRQTLEESIGSKA